MAVAIEVFEDLSKQTMKNIFGINISATDIVVKDQFSLLPDEKIMAALSFSGGYMGKLLLLLKKDEIDGVVELFTSRYNFDLAINAEAVLAEFLNIYAANIVRLSSEQSTFSEISAPDGDLCLAMQTESQGLFVFVVVTTAQELQLRFCYCLG